MSQISLSRHLRPNVNSPDLYWPEVLITRQDNEPLYLLRCPHPKTCEYNTHNKESREQMELGLLISRL